MLTGATGTRCTEGSQVAGDACQCGQATEHAEHIIRIGAKGVELVVQFRGELHYLLVVDAQALLELAIRLLDLLAKVAMQGLQARDLHVLQSHQRDAQQQHTKEATDSREAALRDRGARCFIQRAWNVLVEIGDRARQFCTGLRRDNEGVAFRLHLYFCTFSVGTGDLLQLAICLGDCDGAFRIRLRGAVDQRHLAGGISDEFLVEPLDGLVRIIRLRILDGELPARLRGRRRGLNFLAELIDEALLNADFTLAALGGLLDKLVGQLGVLGHSDRVVLTGDVLQVCCRVGARFDGIANSERDNTRSLCLELISSSDCRLDTRSFLCFTSFFIGATEYSRLTIGDEVDNGVALALDLVQAFLPVSVLARLRDFEAIDGSLESVLVRCWGLIEVAQSFCRCIRCEAVDADIRGCVFQRFNNRVASFLGLCETFFLNRAGNVEDEGHVQAAALLRQGRVLGDLTSRFNRRS